MEPTDDRGRAAAFGAALRRAREQARSTQGDLATAIGYRDKTAISKMEGGHLARPPSRDLIDRIAEALDTSPGPMLVAAGYDQDPASMATAEINEIMGLLETADEALDKLRRRLGDLSREA